MKYIFSLIMILSTGLFFSGCEGDENGRMPDDIKDVMKSLLVIDIDLTHPFINLDDPLAYRFVAEADLLFEGDFNRIDIVIVYNKDYANQYVITSITTVPTLITVTGQNIIDAIPALNGPEDIKEGDVFDIFTSIELTDGTFLPGKTIFGASTLSSSVGNMTLAEKGVNATHIHLVNVPCPFDIQDYLGAVDYTEFWAPDLFEYAGEVRLDPDYTGTDPTKIGLILGGIWDGTWNLRVELSTYDYSIIGLPESQVMGASVFGYSTPTWSRITGTVNTCEQTLEVNINRFCVTVGCFGGMPITYTSKKIIPVGKKATELRNIQIPLRADRVVE